MFGGYAPRVPGTSSNLVASSARRRSPLIYALAALWLLLWSLICLVEVAASLHDPRVPHWHPLVIVAISTLVVGTWLALAIGLRRFERLPIDQPGRWFRQQLIDLPVLVLVVVFVVPLLRDFAARELGIQYFVIPPYLRISFETGKFVLFYLLWVALMFGLLTLEKRREESERLLGAQKALAEAQLAQLQSQLRPHFLFNALNTVSSLMLTDTARADRVLTQLGDLLRASLRRVQAGPVPLRDELDMLGKYADIMRERFEDRAVLHWEVADDVLDVPVPPMLLQPLLENAFKHGVERSIEPVHISIRIRRGDRVLKLEVHNTGSSVQTPATASARTADGESGVGLTNCRERLRLLYGDAAWLWVIDDLSGGVSATVTLPCPTPAV
jgi:hypothetical protein